MNIDQALLVIVLVMLTQSCASYTAPRPPVRVIGQTRMMTPKIGIKHSPPVPHLIVDLSNDGEAICEEGHTTPLPLFPTGAPYRAKVWSSVFVIECPAHSRAFVRVRSGHALEFEERIRNRRWQIVHVALMVVLAGMTTKLIFEGLQVADRVD